MPPTGTIVITGGGGFVGGHIVRLALEKGYTVRLTARSASSAQKAAAQHPAYVNTPQLTTAIVPDITDTSSYESVFDDAVTGVIHSASPFNLKPEDNVRDLLEPAIQGCTSILEAVKRWGPNVKRVVSTSSFASIVDIGKGKREGYTYSEADWNPVLFDEAAKADGVVAYCASKALAERAMWDWLEKNKADVHFTLATICPPWVFGPYVSELRDTKHLSESVGLLNSMIDAKEVLPFDFGGYADVREVAAAHLGALETPEAAGQRFLVGQKFRFQIAVDVGRKSVPGLKDRLPEGKPGYIEPAYNVDGSKAAKVLGLQYKTIDETVKDTYTQLLHAKTIESAAIA
ncbi:NAD(P)-binding protein [Xylariaceae sp. FL1651]|nr:NAD(P)-binding protein [Xylariaceae sp. FL1651]